jgi:hypothetical protein
MAFEHEQRDALQLLQGIENGTLRGSEAARQIEAADPALVYFVFTWLRSRYKADHAAAEGVLGRLVELTNLFPSIKAHMREGKADPVVTWFEEGHNYNSYTAAEFIATIVEKLEG